MFDTYLPIILKFEGGFANNPNDPGGRTNFGVIQTEYNIWRKAHSLQTRDVKDITHDEVEAIYKGYYKDSCANLFDTSHPHTALCQFDCAINQGSGTSKYLLQRAINQCWNYQKIMVDGIVGAKTLAALIPVQDDALLKNCLTLRRDRYLNLITARPRMSEFKASWFHRLNKIAEISQLDWRA